MSRLLLSVLALLFLLPLPADAAKKKKKRYHSSASEKRGWDSSHEPRLKGTPSLVLESVDLGGAHAMAWVTGVSRPPDARMFTLHDDRDRHYMTLGARCAATLSENQYRCELDLPRFYLKRRILGLTVHIHHQEIRADRTTVVNKFAAAPVAAGAPHVVTPPTDAAAATPADAPPSPPQVEPDHDTDEGEESGDEDEQPAPSK